MQEKNNASQGRLLSNSTINSDFNEFLETLTLQSDDYLVTLDDNKLFDRLIADSQIELLFNQLHMEDIDQFPDGVTIVEAIYDKINSHKVKVEARDLILQGEKLHEIQQWFRMSHHPVDHIYFKMFIEEKKQ